MEEKNIKDKAENQGKSPIIPVTMKPLFRWSSIIVLVFGLILGLLLGLAYWIYSPHIHHSASNTGTSDNNTSLGLAGILGLVPDGPYQSTVNIQVVAPGSEYTPLSDLQQRAEYYSAKVQSLPFFQFLSQKLSEQIPGFSDNVDQLSKKISSNYSYSDLPYIKVIATALTEKEAVALTELIPQDFNEYLVFNQKEKLQRDYAATQDSIDTVKSALIQAQQELNALKQNDVSNNNTDVIIIKARIDALQQSLNNEIANISSQSNNDLQAEYNDTIEQIKTTNGKIVEVSNQLIAISGNPVTDNTTNDPQIIVLQAKITALKTELDKEMAIFVTLTASGDLTYTDASASINNLAKELANANQQLNNLQRPVTNNTAIESPEYQIAQIQLDTLNAQKDALNKKLSQLYQQILNSSGGQDYLSQIRTQFSNTSADLTTAKNQLNTLEAQLGYNSTSNNLNIQVAQNKVDNLNQELDSLTKQLGTLVTGDINSLETDYLVAGTPSAPVPILPQRAKAKTSLMEGAVIGILLAWVFWNVRWFKAKLSSMGGAKHEAENKPQAQQ